MSAMPIDSIHRPSADERIRAALWFAERGFGVFSVWSTTGDGICRCPAGKTCEQPGKHPVTAHGFHDATTDEAKIRTLLSAGSNPNYGLVCPDGVFALDVDGEGVARLAELEAKLGPLPDTLRTRTANGEHIFLRWPTSHPRPIGQLFGFVTRWGSGRDAGYVIGPRSVHASGAVYAPVGTVFEIAELPDAWARSVVAPRPTSSSTITVTGSYALPERVAASESRYEAIRAYVAHLYNRRIAREEMLPLILARLAPRFETALTEGEIRSRFERAVAKLAERLGEPRGEEVKAPREIGPGIDAADLLELDLPPIRWIVPDLIPDGTTIIAAPPKVGKSCFVYQVVVEAALGGDLLGKPVERGSALYLALEDGKRRGQERLRAALAGRTMPRGRLEVRWDARPIGAGFEEDIAAWLDAHPDALVVAVDTLQRVRPVSSGKRGAYEVDVDDLGRLQGLFRDRRVALLIVHHARKDGSNDDFLASVSGTYGITGSADTIIVIRRKRLEVFGQILVTGRDVRDAQSSVRFDGMVWQSAPEALASASFERREVLRVIEEIGPIFPAAIADELGGDRTSVAHMVRKLAEDGAITRSSRGYVSTSPLRIRSDQSDRGREIDHSNHSETGRNGTSLISITDHSDHSVIGVIGDTHVRAREADPVDVAPVIVPARDRSSVPCRSYTAHQSHHYRRDGVWHCRACEEDA
jgi:hypothetical protein